MAMLFLEPMLNMLDESSGVRTDCDEENKCVDN